MKKLSKCRRESQAQTNPGQRRPSRKLTAQWEARLKAAGLSMEAGRREWISYGFTTAELDFDGRRIVRPITQGLGEGLETSEWPVSL